MTGNSGPDPNSYRLTGPGISGYYSAGEAAAKPAPALS